MKFAKKLVAQKFFYSLLPKVFYLLVFYVSQTNQNS